LSEDSKLWLQWWGQHGHRAKAGARHRLGRLWTPEDDFRILEAPASSPEERWLSYLELCVRTGEAATFDPGAFVVVQRRQLEVWRSLYQGRAGHRGAVRGAWPARW